MILFNEVPPPTISPLIQIVTEQKVEEPVEEIPKEPTLEEKIASNYYECDESIYWISAENATCLPKRVEPVNTPQTTNNTPKTIKSGSYATSGWFPRGQCTWYVSTRRPVGQWNNATSWLWQAKRDGYATGSTPRAGAIAWKSGHVAYVESVSGSSMTVSEANYDYRGSIRTITVPVSSYSAFIY